MCHPSPVCPSSPAIQSPITPLIDSWIANRATTDVELRGHASSNFSKTTPVIFQTVKKIIAPIILHDRFPPKPSCNQNVFFWYMSKRLDSLSGFKCDLCPCLGNLHIIYLVLKRQKQRVCLINNLIQDQFKPHRCTSHSSLSEPLPLKPEGRRYVPNGDTVLKAKLWTQCFSYKYFLQCPQIIC